MAPKDRLLLAAGVVLVVGFAPVPPPRTGVAEAVVNAFGSGPTGVRQALLAAVPHVLQGDRVKRLACLKGETDVAAWLGKRLRAEEVAPGGPVRLRLDGCRPKEALALLAALVEAYESRRVVVEYEALAGGQLQQRVWAARVAQAQGGGAPVVLFERSAMVPRGGPVVLQRPKLVGSGTAR